MSVAAARVALAALVLPYPHISPVIFSIGPLSMSQLLSIAMLGAGLIILARAARARPT